MKIFDAIQQVVPCPITKSTGCQCDRLESINEADETIKAIAQLEHTVGDVQGAIKFKQKPGRPTIIKGIVKGLTPGKHGFHIHEFGDLSKGCESAGGHYNPDGVEHGSLQQGHVGDLGNIVADKSGTARFQIKAERVELSDVVGRAIVIHADEDDLGKGGDEESLKTGNAGERVGCGVIRLKEVVEEEYERQISDKHFDRNQLPQIRRNHLQSSPFEYKEGTISLSKIKPVQSQRVQGLAKKAQNIFLNNEDRPFILDKQGYLVNGHHRFDAAHMLGLKKVPAIMVDADIEDLMNFFNHTSSNKEVMPEDYFKKLLKEKMEKFSLQETIEASQDLSSLLKGIDADLKQREKDLKKLPKKSIYNEKYLSRNLNPDIADYVKGKKTKLIQVRVADLDDDAEDDRFGRVIDPDPDVGVDLDQPILIDKDGVTILDGFHRVYQAKRIGREFIPAEIIDEGESSPGRVKRAGASCKGSVTDLRAKAKKYSGEKGKMYHWCANMKSGRKKS